MLLSANRLYWAIILSLYSQSFTQEVYKCYYEIKILEIDSKFKNCCYFYREKAAFDQVALNY